MQEPLEIGYYAAFFFSFSEKETDTKKTKWLSQEHSAEKERRQGADADTVMDTNKLYDNRGPAIMPYTMNCKYGNDSLNQQSRNKTIFLDDFGNY